MAVASAAIPWVLFGVGILATTLMTSPERIAGFVPGIAVASAIVSISTLFVVAFDAVGRGIRRHTLSLAALALAMNGLAMLGAWAFYTLLAAAAC